jgi:hypothetical protein
VVPVASVSERIRSFTVTGDRADDGSQSSQALPADVRNLLLAAGVLLLLIGAVTARIFSRRHARQDVVRSVG